jgi:hypothetical protein
VISFSELKMEMTTGLRRFFLLSLVIGMSSLLGDETISFNEDIRPILSDKCFFCHGPDSSKREAELRLDDRDSAIASGAIVPGQPEQSAMLARILSDDQELIMPPPHAKLVPLNPAEIETLKNWIKLGAPYEKHWSFIPLKSFETTDKNISRTVDSLIQNSLSKRGLTQQQIASKTTLIRRLSFDLTGVPPTPQEVDAFLNDRDSSAVELLVDRLLASPRYGERMAVDWLDVARYADSYGFQVDREREVWFWRDWVIQAFNRNQPFDEFVTWQLAGDLLPNATDEQILATAFNRLHQQESEGGSVEEEYRVEYVSDRVHTFATAFLGLTLECARCHDHKYDPISQKEYYQLFSMFQNIDEAGLYAFFTNSPPTPALTLQNAESAAKLANLRERIAVLESQLSEKRSQSQVDFEKWLNSPLLTETRWITGEQARFPMDFREGNQLANTITPTQPAVIHGENGLVEGRQGQAIKFTGDDPVALPLGNFHRHQPFGISMWIKTPDEKSRSVVMHRSRAWTDAASRGYELLLEEGRLKWSLIHFWPGNAMSIAAKEKFPIDQWVHVTVTSDGSSKASGLAIYVNGRKAEVEAIKDSLTREITGGGGDNITLGERFRDRGFTGGAVDDLRVFDTVITPLAALAIYDEAEATTIASTPPEQLTPEVRSQLFDWYLHHQDAAYQALLKDLQHARIEEAKYFEGLKEIMVMKELPTPKPAYVLFRGEYAQRREQVFGGVPQALSPFPKNAPLNRLGLARWLTSPDHPLMARVTVNRVWQSIFGRGLVKTSEDFGSQGSRPLYPEALDTLADYFIRSGWDMKKLIKAIVMTKTYQQASFADATVMADDPDNDWLARGPRFRLPAEMIRDNALAAAGLLKEKIGGPPVQPYEMLEAFKPAAVSGGDDAYRRSLYTNWRRTGPPPAMLAFDAPRRAVCIAKRERTDSPLQALILLNGIQYVEAARILGQELWLVHQGNVEKMIIEGCQRCWSRSPDEVELRILSQLWDEQVKHFQSHPELAKQILTIGNKQHDPKINSAEAAAATVLAQALMNHDECVVKR